MSNIETSKLIFGENAYYDSNDKTRNGNTLIIGGSGCGKSRFVLEPNLFQLAHRENSVIISDPKGTLHDKYHRLFEQNGFRTLNLNFLDPSRSNCKFNLFSYIHKETAEQDIISIAHALIYAKKVSNADPFWDQASELLLSALMAYLAFDKSENLRTLESVLKLLDTVEDFRDGGIRQNGLDGLIEESRKRDPNSLAYKYWHRLNQAAEKTLRSIYISLTSNIGLYDTKALRDLMCEDTVHLETFDEQKTILFVTTSDCDRSYDRLIGALNGIIIKEEIRKADALSRGSLKMPLYIIYDDMANTSYIECLATAINSVRSRNINIWLCVQGEEQLRQRYHDDASSLINSCDTQIYLGGSDLHQADIIAQKLDIPRSDVLYMPVGVEYIFRRGERPLKTTRFNWDNIEELKENERNYFEGQDSLEI